MMKRILNNAKIIVQYFTYVHNRLKLQTENMDTKNEEIKQNRTEKCLQYLGNDRLTSIHGLNVNKICREFGSKLCPLMPFTAEACALLS